MLLKFSKLKRDYTFMDLKYDQATAIRKKQNAHDLTYSEENSQPIQGLNI